MANEDARKALMNIEGFRSLNQDIETIINKSEAVKKAKKKANDKELTKKQKEQLSAEKGIQKQKKRNTRQAYQICNPCSGIYVFNRL